MSPAVKALLPVAVTLVIWFLPVPQGLTPEALHYLAIFLGVVVGLIVEPIPAASIGVLGVTLATVFMLVPQAGGKAATAASSTRWALSGFSNSVVWLIFIAYMLSMGYEKTGLGRRIAMHLIRRLGGGALSLGYAMALADGVLAPFTPSSTARSGGTIFPILKNIPPMYGSLPDQHPRRIGSFLMWLGVVNSGATSSMFLTGGAFNVLAVSIARDAFHLNVTWAGWLLALLPMGLAIFLGSPLLAYILYPPEQKHFPDTPGWAAEELKKLGLMSGREIIMGLLAIGALTMWVIGDTVMNASVVGLVVLCLMLLTKVVSWDDVLGNRQAWNVFVWFGTLVTLASGLGQVGFLTWLAEHFSAMLAGYSLTAITAGLLALFYFSHYFFASLTAHVTAMLPIVLTAAGAVPGMNLLAFFYLCGCSLGIMGVISPYGSGPNPIFYGSGYIPSKDFWRLGAIFGVLFFAVLTFMGIPYTKMLFS